MKAKKESVNEKIDSLAIMVANGFASVDKRFDELKRDFDQSFNEHIETIRSDYDGLTSRVKQLEINKK